MSASSSDDSPDEDEVNRNFEIEAQVCWLSVNDAIPLGSDPELELNSMYMAIQTTTFQPKTEISETAPITVQPIITSTPISGNGRAYRSIDSANDRPRIKQHEIMKKTDGELTQPEVRQKGHRSPPKVSQTDNNDPKIHISNVYSSFESHHNDFEEWGIPLKKAQVNDKCVNEERRQNQSYTRSIPLNTSSINSDEDFEIPGEPEVKRINSVHIGEDIALCWIETTTIKEDNLFNPPKRLVIREFTISFENSASIPDSYLECNDIEGEIAPGDEDTIRNTALHEVIDENSKRSREVNFSHVSTVGRIVVRQHKKVKCGVGAVVSKNIFEWPDGTDNPKKRVEIKVGPSIRDLRSTTNNGHAGCTTEGIRRKAQIKHNRKSSSTSNDETLPSCESGDCSRNVTSCEGDCSRKSLSEETTYPPNSDELLSTGVTEETTTMEPNGTKLLMALHSKSDRNQDEPCSEFDTDCMSLQRTYTVEPQSVNESSESCSGEDCHRGSLEEPNRELSCDQSSDASCSCSGDNCVSKENSTSSSEDSAKITVEDGEMCKNGSESCNCNGSACSTQNSEETKFVESEAKRTDISLHETNENTTKPLVKLTHSIPPSQMDSNCIGGAGLCSERNVPPQSNSNEEKNRLGTVEPMTFNEHLKSGAFSEQNGMTEVPEVTRAIKFLGEIGDTPGTGNLKSCERSGPGNCSKMLSDGTMRPNATSEDTEEHFSSVEDTTFSKVLSKALQSSNLNSNEIRNSSTCSEGDEECTTVQLSKEFVSSSNSANKMSDETSGSSGIETLSSTSEQSMLVTTIRFNDTESEEATPRSYQKIEDSNGGIGLVFTNDTDREMSTKESSTDAIATGSSENEKLSSEKRLVTDCSTDSGNSVDCVQLTVTHPSSLADVSTVPSVLDSSSSSDETNEKVEGQDQVQAKTASICDNDDESCQDSSSSSKSTETCEDGSTNCRSGSIRPISTSCGSGSDSCSSETNESSMNTTKKSTPEKLGLHSTTNDTVSSITETRRSIIPTTPLSTAVKGRHRLALRIKVLLEHIDENKGKEKLVQVEKHLLLKENSSEHGNHSLMWQLQALNNSMNLETLKAIFNCSALKSLSIDEIDVDDLAKDAINDEINNLKEVRPNSERKAYLKNTTVVLPEEKSEPNDKNLNNRKKREISSSFDITPKVENAIGSTTVVFVENATDSTTVISVENATESATVISVENATDSATVISVENATDSATVVSVENATDSTTVVSVDIVTDSTNAVSVEKGTDTTTRKAILHRLPGVEEDLTNGMNHVLSLISKDLGDSTTTDVNTTPSSISSKILKILSDPSDSRVHFARPKITPRIKRTVKIHQLITPVHGEEIERWTKERFVSAASGGQIRRLMEFKILRDNSEDS